MPPLLVSFSAGALGPWRIESVNAVRGQTLASAERLLVSEGETAQSTAKGVWTLHGVTSNMRYTARAEAQGLAANQQGLARAAATHAALIPIRKSAAWWDLAQDERRAIFEERSRHIAIGMKYLPAVARRLHHCRDLLSGGGPEPFDFLTWFEYAPEHEAAFDDLVASLRATPEWDYVDREVDLRLSRA